MSRLHPRVVGGALLAGVGAALALMPYRVGAALGRPTDTSLEVIELRVTVGGVILGLGAFIAACRSLRPWRTSFATFVVWMMAALAATRTLGIAVDGGPDRAQWFWLAVEVALLAIAAAYLRRAGRADGGSVGGGTAPPSG